MILLVKVLPRNISTKSHLLCVWIWVFSSRVLFAKTEGFS